LCSSHNIALPTGFFRNGTSCASISRPSGSSSIPTTGRMGPARLAAITTIPSGMRTVRLRGERTQRMKRATRSGVSCSSTSNALSSVRWPSSLTLS
jgi:hypothetical protein